MSVALSKFVFLRKFDGDMEGMSYNTQLEHLIIPEYGRNIQSMIDHCCGLPEKEERNRCAKTIIQVMGQLNTHLRDIPDFNHKLWDHLFIISKFRLDVDSPYPRPSAETFDSKPESVPYPRSKIKYRYYGKLLEEVIRQSCKYAEGEEKEVLKFMVASQMKKSYLNWNKDAVQDEVIFQHLSELSGGKVTMGENDKLADATELIKRNTSAPVHKKFHKKHHKNFKRK